MSSNAMTINAEIILLDSFISKSNTTTLTFSTYFYMYTEVYKGKLTMLTHYVNVNLVWASFGQSTVLEKAVISFDCPFFPVKALCNNIFGYLPR
jgi:hypothetical protein